MSGTDEKLLWTVDDVASYLQCSTSKVYKLVAAERIPCVRIDGLLRFDPPAVKAWATTPRHA